MPEKVYCPKHPEIEALVYSKVPGRIDSKCVWCIEREARLEEAKWWIKHLEECGDEVLDSDRARIAALEKQG